MDKEVNVDLLPHQYDFVVSNEPNPAIIGGLGSGKTEAGIQRVLRFILEDKEADLLYMMPTYDLLRLRAMPGVEDSLARMGIDYKANKSASEIIIKGHGKILFRSYDRPERIIAFEVAHCIVDEIDTLNKEKASYVWRKITERIRQKTSYMVSNNIPNSIACVTTPDQGYSGFVYDRWVKNAKKGYELIKASTYDNFFLPEGYTDQILANYDPILADLYLRGEFVSLTQNKQFWAFDRVKHHVDEVLESDAKLINLSIDFNVGGSVVIIWKRVANKLIAVDEIVGQNTQDAIQRVNSAYPDAKKIAFPDASGGNESANADVTSLGLMKQAGWTINAPKANPSVRGSINTVNNLLSKDRLLVNTDKCPMLTEALEALGYDDKGRPEKFDDHPSWDDYGDCTRYIAHRLYPVRRPTLIGAAP